jgi:hypothetical protein
MSKWRRAASFAIFAGVGAILVVPSLIHRNSASVASLALGTDDAFSSFGMEPRENQIGGGALRWTRPRAGFHFEGVGPGLVEVHLEVRGHRTEVSVSANGARIGALSPGQARFSSRVSLVGTSLDFGLETEGFEASGRALGTQFVSLTVVPERASLDRPGSAARLWLAVGGVVLVSAAAAAWHGSLGIGALQAVVFILLLVLPAGLWRSGWLVEAAVLTGLAAVVAVWAASRARGSAASRGFLEVCLFVAVMAHGVLPPSPLVVQGDAQLHGNKLAEVARGNLFPTTRTDHSPPFEIPYGFSFYGLLSPFAGSGPSNVSVVRHGAAAFSALCVVGLALVTGRASAGLAAAATLLWTFAPVNLRTMGYGNLSNVFAQSIFLIFLVAAASMSAGRLRSFLLTALAALSATAHLSSFIVLVALLLVSLALAPDRGSAAFKPLLIGTTVAALYFSSFLPLIAAQAARLLGERGGSSGVFDPWRMPGQILAGLGWPLLATLALSGLVAAFRPILPLSRSLLATGALLALAALVSPVEVRYLLAISPLVAVLAAALFDEDQEPAFPRQTLSSIVHAPLLRGLGAPVVKRSLGACLLAAAVINGVRILLEFVPLSGG